MELFCALRYDQLEQGAIGIESFGARLYNEPPMTIRGGVDPPTSMDSVPPCRLGLPPRSFAADAYACIMVAIRTNGSTEYKVATRYPRPWRAPLGRTPKPSQVMKTMVLTVSSARRRARHRQGLAPPSAVACGDP